MLGGVSSQDLQDQAKALQGPFSLAMGVFSFMLKIFDRVKKPKVKSKRKGK